MDHATSAVHPKYRPDIDGLRGIAVTAVVLYHAFPNFLPGGFVGVDVFFIISGFLISNLIFRGIEAQDFSFIDFYARRIRRIFPALIIVLCSAWIIGWLLLLIDEYTSLGVNIAGGASFVSNFVLLKQSGYFEPAASKLPLLHLWSLGIEEQFYLLGPLLLWLAYKMRLPILPILCLAGILSFAINIQFARINPASDFYLPWSRAWEIILGCVLAWLTVHPVPEPVFWPKAGARSVIGILMLVTTILFAKEPAAFPKWFGLMPTIAAMLIISGGESSWVNRIIAWPALIWIGLISYPLYLWHWPLLSFANIFAGGVPSLLSRSLLVLLSILLAYLTFRCLERHIRSSRKPLVVLGLIASCAVVGIIGYATYLESGFPSRLPEPLRALRNEVNIQKEWREHRCFLNFGDTPELFKNECVDREPAEAKLVVLWGDSHAASLYPGIKEAQAQHSFRLAQFTASACQPILGNKASPNLDCRAINDSVLHKIGEVKPDIVLLHAYWHFPELDLPRLSLMIDALKALDVPRIVILGDVPNWPEGLPKRLEIAYRKTGEIPLRSRPDESKNGDEELAEVARKKGVTFISAMSNFCIAEECTTEINGKLVQFDTAHLTTAGSVSLAEAVINRVLGSMPAELGRGN